MEWLATGILALLGSAAVATWLGNRWERRRIEATELAEAYKAIGTDQAAFSLAIGRCIGFLRIQADWGKIWAYQKREFTEALRDAHARAITLRVSSLAYAAINPDAANAANQLADGIVIGWCGRGPSPHRLSRFRSRRRISVTRRRLGRLSCQGPGRTDNDRRRDQGSDRHLRPRNRRVP